MKRSGPVLKYPGSKWSIAEWIVSNMPEHRAYVEPYFGSGAVLLAKPQSRTELVNDLDGRVVNLFRVLREQPVELALACAMTPYARDEWKISRDIAADPLEDARRFLVTCWTTRGGSTNRKYPGFRFDINGAANGGLARVWANLPLKLLGAAERFRSVVIENRPALELLEVIRKRGQATLVYADPPYLSRIRDDRLYTHEMREPEHIAMLDALDRHPGPVLLSAYEGDLYTERLAAWSKVLITSRNQTNKRRIEVLWMNRVAAESQSRLGLEPG